MDEEDVKELKRELVEEVEAKKHAHVSVDPAAEADAEGTGDAAEGAPDPDDPAAIEAQQTQDELDALQTVFDDIRHQSRMSNLVKPERWSEQGMVPAHMTSQQFVDLVFEVMACGGKAPAAAAESNEDSAEEVPADGAAAEAAAASNNAAEEGGTTNDKQDAATASAPASTQQAQAPADGDEPENATAAEPQQSDAGANADAADEPTGALKAILSGAAVIPCTDILSMEGKETMYLYSDEQMTDTYARWAFLAAEDDVVATFVECVRQESKTYPRPMCYKSLMNHPFDMTEDEVLDAWKATQETNLYPDIQSCEASNGDVYFFSTDYLTPFYAQSLAEWASVERWMSP